MLKPIARLRWLTGIYAHYPALANRPFVLFLGGYSMAVLGDQFNVLALSVVLYEITGNVSAISGMWIARIASRLIVQPISGALVDRLNRKKVLIFSYVANAIVALGFIFASQGTLWLMYALTFILQTVEGFASPALNASLPTIVQKEHLISANALRSIAGKTASSLGPALAGLLYARLGPTPLFLFNSLGFLSIVFTVLFLPIPSHGSVDRARSILKDMTEGIRYSITHVLVLPILVLSLVNSLVWRVMEIVLVPVAHEVFEIGPQGLGLLYSVLTLGGLAGALIAPRFRGETVSMPVIVGIYACLAFPLLIFGALPYLVTAFAMMFFSGVVLDFIAIFTNTALQAHVPNNMLGRVFAMMNVSLALGVIPGLIGLNSVVERVGLTGTILVNGSVLLITSLCILMWTRFIDAKKGTNVDATASE